MKKYETPKVNIYAFGDVITTSYGGGVPDFIASDMEWSDDPWAANQWEVNE